MKNLKRQKTYKESGSKKNVFLCPLFSLPNSALQQICLLIKPPNISRKVSGSTGGAMGSAQMQIWLYSSLYLLPKSTTAPKVRSLKLIARMWSAALAHLLSLAGWKRGVWQIQLGYIQQQGSVGSCHSLRQVMCSPRGIGPGSFIPQQSQATSAPRNLWAETCACSQLGGSCVFWGKHHNNI